MDQSVLNKAFLTIWTSPRKTIRRILDTGSTKYIYLLAVIAGITSTLNRAAGTGMGDDTPLLPILFLAIILGPIGGIISIHLGAILIHWTGKWIGGAGSKREIRIAYAWAYVPTILSLIIWIIELFIFGREMFTSELGVIGSNPGMTTLFFIIGAIDIVIMVWGIIILIKSIAEAQQFSSWKAVGNILLSALVVLVPIFLIGLLIFFIVT
ncbi:YIP1 family protein [Pseudalkalibacillus sp. Hm43]|uniref:YIP1 family protein n=1 Tax=Pseudalkalibacillus sp. Hm43 TaxID=3450742 RepID=UPI003F4330DF